MTPRATTLPLSLLASALLALPSTLHAQDAPTLAHAETPDLVAIYKDLHAHPELSHYEERTSTLLAKALRGAGYTVTERVRQIPRRLAGLRRRRHPQKRPRLHPPHPRRHGRPPRHRGNRPPLRLARRHQNHVWPERRPLHRRHARLRPRHPHHRPHRHRPRPRCPQVPVARHPHARRPALRGNHRRRQGHARRRPLHPLPPPRPHYRSPRHQRPPRRQNRLRPRPHPRRLHLHRRRHPRHRRPRLRAQRRKDPVTLAAYFITQMQTIVSREEDPQDPTVVTVGDIHGGTKRNIIPDEVKLELTVRTFSDRARQTVITGLNQMAAGLTTSAGLPPAKAATVTVLDNESTPVLYNDPTQTRQMGALLATALGKNNVVEQTRVMGSEDVGVFGLGWKPNPDPKRHPPAGNPGNFPLARRHGPHQIRRRRKSRQTPPRPPHQQIRTPSPPPP